MTQRKPRRSPLFAAIHTALRPSTATAAVVTLALATAGPASAAMENGSPGKATLRPENLATRDEILFVDAQVADPKRLLVGAKQGVETVILEDGRDALEQITQVLAQKQPVAVHLVAHGEQGRLRLGDTWLDGRQLDANVALIRRWFAGLESGHKPDLLLYACNLAEGSDGVAFVEKLAEISGADVAASDDLTGHSDLQGDWDLEVQTGDIEAELAFSEITVEEYRSTLATFTVNTTNDNYNSTEECDVTYCTLRDAIYEADANNNDPTVDVINFSLAAKGVSVMYIENDFDIEEAVTITGPGINELTIDADDEDRIFDINTASPTTITDMRLQEGFVYEYGGCIEATETDLTLDEVYFYSCYADEPGGAIYFESEGASELYVRNSMFVENGSDYDGGAITWGLVGETGGALVVENSDFDANYAEEEGGAIAFFGSGSSLTVRDSNFTENYAEGEEGGAILVDDAEDGTVVVENSYFYNNRADGEEGGAIFFDADGTEITIRDSEFVENDAYYDGGAIGFEDADEGAEASDMLVENSYFYGNDANEGEGGAINFDTYAGATLTIQYSEFVENEAYGHGGGLQAYGESGDVTIRHSLFEDNVASDEGGGDDGGGASFYNMDSVFIYSSSFVNNSAYDGGGIQAEQNESVTIVNSTFSGNEAYDSGDGVGGAMELDENGDVSIRNTTIVFNDAYSGGGIFNDEADPIEVINTIVSGNTADNGPDLFNEEGGDFAVSFSLISDTGEAIIEDNGGNIFGYSANVGPLDDSQGPTPVHVPLEGSPAIDTGDPNFTPPPDFDQRGPGFPRVLGTTIDMGSVEGQGFAQVIPTLSRWGLALMGLLMGALSLIGFQARKRENRET